MFQFSCIIVDEVSIIVYWLHNVYSREYYCLFAVGFPVYGIGCTDTIDIHVLKTSPGW